MTRKSDRRKSKRETISTDYLNEPGYGTVYIRTAWMKKIDRLERLEKNRKKRSKIDKWRFKNNYSRKRKVY